MIFSLGNGNISHEESSGEGAPENLAANPRPGRGRGVRPRGKGPQEAYKPGELDLFIYWRILAHWYGSQSACLVPCRPRFKSMWGDHALPSLQTGHILSQWILLEFWNVHNVEDARYWAVIFEVLLRSSWNFRKIWLIEYVLICSWNVLINMYT